MFGGGFRVYLVKKEQVDELAQLVFGQPATENCITEICLRCCQPLLLSHRYVSLFCRVSGHV